MEKINYMNIVPFFIKWEGGLSRNQFDSAKSYPCPTSYKGEKGYHTNKGVTYATWVDKFGRDKDERFLNMNDEDWGIIFKEKYWDKVKGDLMPAQFVADVLVSWAWGSGSVTAIKQMQRHLGFSKQEQDGIIGKQTIAAIDKQVKKDPKAFFEALCNTREQLFRYISDPKNGKNESQRIRFQNNSKNLQGWLNRLSQFRSKFAPK